MSPPNVVATGTSHNPWGPINFLEVPPPSSGSPQGDSNRQARSKNARHTKRRQHPHEELRAQAADYSKPFESKRSRGLSPLCILTLYHFDESSDNHAWKATHSPQKARTSNLLSPRTIPGVKLLGCLTSRGNGPSSPIRAVFD